MRALVFVFVLVLGCGSSMPMPGRIIGAEEATSYLGAFAGQENVAYFTPSQADVDALEGTLERYLKTQRRAQQVARRLGDYCGTFYGAVVDGHRRVHALYSCGGCSRFIVVNDGGSCYFDLDFDPDRHTYGGFYVHGHA
jgi:hypothetical protein